jgi:uncharacterized phage protein (TIGR01671 family)
MIKFRAWDIKNKKMILPDSVADELIMYMDGRLFVPQHSRMVNDKYILMQSTGLSDKNGVELYAGDIFEAIDGDGDGKLHTWKVIYKDGGFCGECLDDYGGIIYFHYWLQREIEKIGDIHTTKEMGE